MISIYSEKGERPVRMHMSTQIEKDPDSIF